MLTLMFSSMLTFFQKRDTGYLVFLCHYNEFTNTCEIPAKEKNYITEHWIWKWQIKGTIIHKQCKKIYSAHIKTFL